MILTFDIGTSALKGAVIRESGEFHSYYSETLVPADNRSYGRSEVDPGEWIRGIKNLIPKLMKDLEESSIRGLVISGNGPTLVPIDDAGEVLYPVMNWMDRRGTVQSSRITAITGFYLDPSFYLPKALWLYDEVPESYEKAASFLSCPEYVIHRLTGEAVTILPGKDFEKYYWTPELLEKLKLDKNKFPAFYPPGTIVGKINGKAAGEFCLPSGIPVVASGPDFLSSILGTATVRPGRACDRAGTSEGINLCTETMLENRKLMSYGHVIEPYYNISGIISASGRALGWIKNILKAEPEIAETVPAGAENLIFLPYLAGERAPLWDPRARGAFIGLGLNHGPEQMIRAVLESTGFAMRDVIETMEETGCRVEDMRITGGPSKNYLWNQIKADITGRRLLLPDSPDPDLSGNLIFGLLAFGEYKGLAEASEAVVRMKRMFEPRKDLKGRYDDLFGSYKAAYVGLKDIFHQLS